MFAPRVIDVLTESPALAAELDLLGRTPHLHRRLEQRNLCRFRRSPDADGAGQDRHDRRNRDLRSSTRAEEYRGGNFPEGSAVDVEGTKERLEDESDGSGSLSGRSDRRRVRPGCRTGPTRRRVLILEKRSNPLAQETLLLPLREFAGRPAPEIHVPLPLQELFARRREGLDR